MDGRANGATGSSSVVADLDLSAERPAIALDVDGHWRLAIAGRQPLGLCAFHESATLQFDAAGIPANRSSQRRIWIQQHAGVRLRSDRATDHALVRQLNRKLHGRICCVGRNRISGQPVTTFPRAANAADAAVLIGRRPFLPINADQAGDKRTLVC